MVSIQFETKRVEMMYRVFTLFTAVVFSAMSGSIRAGELLSVRTYTANEGGFLSNSHMVSDGTETVVIDAQFSVFEGLKVSRVLQSSQQRLSKIIVTHPHPDHFYGIEILGAQFPDAQIYSGELTKSALDSSIGYWLKNLENDVGFAQTNEFENGEFTIGTTQVVYRVFRSGESAENTILYVPEQQILFVGDLASNGVHLWLAEGNWDNWLAQLDMIKLIGPIKTVYPGHGPVGGRSLLDAAEGYIKNFSRAIESSESQVQAIQKMMSLYPNYKLPQILSGSVQAAMAGK